MRILANENVPGPVVAALRERGHDVVAIKETAPGVSDRIILERARVEARETNALAGPDRVLVPLGTYVLTIPGAGEDAGATGDLDVTDTLELVGGGATGTVIDAAGLDRVIEFDTPT